jgi:Predicted membrane protein (DUF2214)
MFDFAATDLTLAIVHHLLVFLLAGVLAFEIGVIRPSMKREDVVRVARVDLWYGILAGAIIVVGFSRAIFAAKGLGLLLGQSVLLGEDGGLCRGRTPLDHPDHAVPKLATGAHTEQPIRSAPILSPSGGFSGPRRRCSR